MFQFVVTRVLWLVPTLLAMALVTFLVMHATPGSPLDPVAEGANPLVRTIRQKAGKELVRQKVVVATIDVGQDLDRAGGVTQHRQGDANLQAGGDRASRGLVGGGAGGSVDAELVGIVQTDRDAA